MCGAGGRVEDRIAAVPRSAPRAAARLVTALLVERRLGEPAPSWQTSGPLLWHNGATGDASVFAGAMADGRWVLVHRLSGDAEGTDQLGIERLRHASPGPSRTG
ncbi:hypothetical protein [Streptomyces sp. DT171]|uniref:hypothetical protein n=1 Tax=Streptomyces sp. DT171 TaxID=3416524 RepID=UPI003CF2E317